MQQSQIMVSRDEEQDISSDGGTLTHDIIFMKEKTISATMILYIMLYTGSSNNTHIITLLYEHYEFCIYTCTHLENTIKYFHHPSLSFLQSP